ncbi:hypothetical protein DFH09DRAFT_1377298 [Mycena vulgaris]|nr:hypothetical protein DFH09DRAFT_1377298 [Mycena vulgaris]
MFSAIGANASRARSVDADHAHRVPRAFAAFHHGSASPATRAVLDAYEPEDDACSALRFTALVAARAPPNFAPPAFEHGRHAARDPAARNSPAMSCQGSARALDLGARTRMGMAMLLCASPSSRRSTLAPRVASAILSNLPHSFDPPSHGKKISPLLSQHPPFSAQALQALASLAPAPSRTYPSQVIKCARFKASNIQALSSSRVFAVGERKIIQASTAAHAPQGMSASLKLSSLKSARGPSSPSNSRARHFSLGLVYVYICDTGFMNTVDDVLPQRNSAATKPSSFFLMSSELVPIAGARRPRAVSWHRSCDEDTVAHAAANAGGIHMTPAPVGPTLWACVSLAHLGCGYKRGPAGASFAALKEVASPTREYPRCWAVSLVLARLVEGGGAGFSF